RGRYVFRSCHQADTNDNARRTHFPHCTNARSQRRTPGASRFSRDISMTPPIIRPAGVNEYDEVGLLWMESWVSTGLAEASNFLLANLRARVRKEIEDGWSLYVADNNGRLAAMLALHLPKRYLDQLFVAPAYQGRSIGRQLLAFTRTQLPDEIHLRCADGNEKAWRWYEREGFVFENKAIEPMNGLMMKYYRWNRETAR